MTQTERLKWEMADTVEVECCCCKYHDNFPMNCYIEPIRSPLCRHRYELADQILKVSKEAGLMFVPDEWDLANLCYQSKRDSGIRSATEDKIHSLIKEIEIG